MRSPAHRLATLALAVVTTGAGGCASVDPEEPQPEAEPLRLGRVHVLLEAEAELSDDLEADYVDALEVTAHFAFVRGLEEEFVRVQIGMPLLATDIVEPSRCVASDTLTTGDSVGAAGAEVQELHLVDAGELRLQIGDDPEEALEVPVRLAPDLLPYMTGYEYHYWGEQMPSELSDDGATAVVVEARGSQTEELPPFRAESVVPPALSPYVTEADLYELSRNGLVLRWNAVDAEELITLRLTGLQGGEPVGTELTCVVSDAGQTRFVLEELRTLGLSLEAEALRVTASRLAATPFDVGDFMGSELFVERRERLVLPLR